MKTDIADMDWTEAPDTVLYLGAGYGEDLEAVLSLPARRIVLVEPNPDCRAALSPRVAADARVALKPQAVHGAASDGAGQATLNVRNLSAYSSLRRATGLRALFPGLRCEAAPQVEAVPIDLLVRGLELAPTGEHLLIVDIPGEEAAVVARLADTGLLELFSHVLLRGGRGELFEGAAPVEAAVAHLIDLGFETMARDEADPDFPSVRFRCPPRTAANRALAAARDALAAELAAAVARAETAEAALRDREAELTAARAAAESLTGQLSAATEWAKSAEAGFRDREARWRSAEVDAESLTGRLSAAMERVAGAEERLKDYAARLTSATAEIGSLTDRLAAATNRAESAEQRQATAECKVEALQRDLEAAAEQARADAARIAELRQAVSAQTERSDEATRPSEELREDPREELREDLSEELR